ncbi:hypothetical protein N8D56_26195 (plasmid) [Devosia sp. A8/3-2]|nr:hypothetical protein N8D56_26195 [Devosia sp. A8/3-2]
MAKYFSSEMIPITMITICKIWRMRFDGQALNQPENEDDHQEGDQDAD